jgi:predicted porin
MKKLLMGTTGLVAVLALPVGAQAADKIELGLGGYYRAVAVYGEQDESDDVRSYGIARESEVYFSGKTTLDNGLKVGAMIQLEGETSEDQIDNSYIWASGGFGRVEFGSTWGPSLLMSAGSVGDHLDGHSDFASQSHHKTLNKLGMNTHGGDAGIAANPDDKIVYYTPNMSGFQMGVSYMPENYPKTDESGTAFSNENDDNLGSELLDVAASYTGNFGGVNFRTYASIFKAVNEVDKMKLENLPIKSTLFYVENETADIEGASFGAQISAEGFTVGGRVTTIEGLRGKDSDRTAWRIGVEYGSGPWAIGTAYMHAAEEVDVLWRLARSPMSIARSPNLNSGSLDNETTLISVSGSYVVAAGIKMFGGVQHIEQSANASAMGRSFDIDDTQNDATIAIIGTKLTF